MEEYYQILKKRRIKKYCIGVIISILLLIISLLLYELYLNIEITPMAEQKQENQVAIKTSQTVENVQNQSKTIADVIEKVNQSVVGISKLKDVGNTIFLEGGSSKLGLGTGVIVAENGYILTNEHVSGAKYSNCYVTLPAGKTYQGNVVWSDSDIDLAIVKINAKNLPYISLGDSDNIRVGETVYAIGNPIGFEFQRTVTAGIISAVNRTIKIEEENKTSYMEDLIQTDATINVGNSGGPLINPNGEMIGINSIKITSAEGIGFAVPINTVKEIITQFAQNEKFEEASLGIFAYDKNVIPYLDSSLSLENGIYVVQVGTATPAYRSGIKAGDIILEIDGTALNKMCDLRCYIYTKKPGDEVTLKVLRNKKEIEIKVVLGKK